MLPGACFNFKRLVEEWKAIRGKKKKLEEFQGGRGVATRTHF
jgi:hypothetical protein